MIYILNFFSPDVPIFREDKNYELLDKPFECSIITCPAPSKGKAETVRDLAEPVNDVMKRRVHNILAVAVANRVHVLVLGAWGCGVFRNDPEDVASYFRFFLQGKFKDAFVKVVFAIGNDENKVEVFRRILCSQQ